jgi:hypothetical protein
MAYANSPFWDAITLLEKTLEDLLKLQAGWMAFPQGLESKDRLAKIDVMIVNVETGLQKLRPVRTTSVDKNTQ